MSQKLIQISSGLNEFWENPPQTENLYGLGSMCLNPIQTNPTASLVIPLLNRRATSRIQALPRWRQPRRKTGTPRRMQHVPIRERRIRSHVGAATIVRSGRSRYAFEICYFESMSTSPRSVPGNASNMRALFPFVALLPISLGQANSITTKHVYIASHP